MVEKKNYRCNTCGFEWHSPEKEYEHCPDCKSEDIYTINVEIEKESPILSQGMGRRGRSGLGAGPPRVCKCNQCGYESPKTPGVPCRNTKCPECGGMLCGAD
jgi:predicted Zn-ribbon and HTH transcriptional regulator